MIVDDLVLMFGGISGDMITISEAREGNRAKF
jgi:hypothetical protein